jgi:hypothetical protein
LPSGSLHLAFSATPVFNLAVVEELLIDVLVGGLVYLFERLVLRLIHHLLPAPAQ